VPRPYVLVAAIGLSPAVLTETAFALHDQDGRQPREVHVVTTGTGAAYVRARLLGEAGHRDIRAQPFEDAEDRWGAFCRDVLGRAAAVPLHLHVPEVGARPIGDVRHRGDDTRFANLCYGLVEELTRDPDALDLVGSIAGGRKTMSAHLMAAFCAYARPTDRLTHVLVADPDLENPRNGFYYPVPGSADYLRHQQALDLVDIPFPPVRAILDEEVLAKMPGERRDLEALRDALAPHAQSPHHVQAVRLRLRAGGPSVAFLGAGDDVLATCELTPKHAATLAVFAEQRLAAGGPVDRDTLYDPEGGVAAVEEQRQAVLYHCGGGTLKPWTKAESLSKDLSFLRNESLKAVPLAVRMLDAQRAESDAGFFYDWPGEPPALTVELEYPGADPWPFTHLKQQAGAAEPPEDGA
jgi:CRISPR-associated protein (TIGR02584 family)